MVITPQSLWRDYDRKRMPLEPTIVGTRDYAYGCEKLIYFNGEAVSNGYVRIFARLVEPLNKTADTKVIIIMAEANMAVTDVEVDHIILEGKSVLVLDYAGDYQNRERYTIYPNQISYCNYNPERALTEFPENPRATCWYTYAVCAFRAISFLESLNYTKFAAIGIAEGGAQVWKLLAFEPLMICGAVLYPSGLELTDESENSFKAGINTFSYASIITKPIMQIIASNDTFGTFKRETEIFDCITTENCALLVEPRSRRVFTYEQYNSLKLFIDSNFNGEPFNMKPSLEASVSEHKLVYTVKTFASPSKIQLYISNSFLQSPYRNWRTIKAELVDENEYIFRPNIYLPNAETYAFCKVYYDNGYTICSNVSIKLPSSMGVTAAELNKKRLIYDTDMGTDDFSCDGNNKISLSLEEGPYSISGVSISKGTLSTFKLGDIVYTGDESSMLQIILHSFAVQKLTFRVTDNSNRIFYAYSNISPNDDWCKVTFASSDFKGSEGTLSNWESVVYFEIVSVSKLLLSSMLWV